MYKVKFLFVIFSVVLFLGATQVPKKTEKNEAWLNKEIERLREDWLNKKVDRLRKKVAKILYNTNVTKEDELAYFEEFPDSFEVFNVIFANSSKKSWGIPDPRERGSNEPRIICKKDRKDTYDYVINCIKAFLNLKSIDKSKLYNKIINIASGGKWDADYVGFFQLFICSIVVDDLEVFCKLLSLRSDAQVRGFWFFYFDGPHPSETIPRNLRKVKVINLRIYNLMVIALQKAHKGACTGH